MFDPLNQDVYRTTSSTYYKTGRKTGPKKPPPSVGVGGVGGRTVGVPGDGASRARDSGIPSIRTPASSSQPNIEDGTRTSSTAGSTPIAAPIPVSPIIPPTPVSPPIPPTPVSPPVVTSTTVSASLDPSLSSDGGVDRDGKWQAGRYAVGGYDRQRFAEEAKREEKERSDRDRKGQKSNGTTRSASPDNIASGDFANVAVVNKAQVKLLLLILSNPPYTPPYTPIPLPSLYQTCT